MTDPPPADLLTIAEFASLFRCSRRTVFNLFSKGLAKERHPGLGVRIRRADAEAFFARNSQESLTPPPPAKIPRQPAPADVKLRSVQPSKKNKTFSLSFNEKRQVWIAQVRKPQGGWATKYLPKTILRHQQVEAEAYLFNWLSGYQKTGEVRQRNVPATRTIKLLADRWLQHRSNDGSTSPNTLRGFKTCMRTWILDSAHPHVPIQDLDIQTQLSASVLLQWIDSLQGSPSNRLAQISCLRSFLNGCIGLGWVDPEMFNPINKPAVLAREKALKTHKEQKRVNAYLTPPQLQKLLTEGKTTFQTDFKRMRYLLAATCGLRDMEIQALQWKDLDLQAGTVRINKQLYKKGCLPLLDYFDARKTHSAEALQKLPNAIQKAPKNDSRRILPIPSLTLEALRYWKKVGWGIHTKMLPSEEAPVFPRSAVSLKPGEKASDFTTPDSSEGFKLDLERAGIASSFEDAMGEKTELTFHSLRHSFSHFLDGVGCPAEEIGVLLGHAARSVGRAIYIPANIEKWRVTVEKLPITSVAFQGRTVGKPVRLALVKIPAAI